MKASERKMRPSVDTIYNRPFFCHASAPITGTSAEKAGQKSTKLCPIGLKSVNLRCTVRQCTVPVRRVPYVSHLFPTFCQHSAPSLIMTRKSFERLFTWISLPLVRHGVFLAAMVVLAITTSAIVGRPNSRQGFFAVQFFVDMYAFCLLLCLLPSRLRSVLKCALYVGAYVLAVVETFLFYRFNLYFSPTMLNLLLETNPNEAGEFLMGCVKSVELWRTLGIYALILLGNVFLARYGYTTWKGVCRALRVHRHRWMQRLGFALRFYLMPTAALGGLTVGLVPWVGEKGKMVNFLRNEHTRDAERMPVHIFYTPFYRLLHAAHFLHIARVETEHLMERMSALRVDSCAAICPNLVVIVGESYNKHHAALYGYDLPTTPHLSRLARRGTLQVFTDVVTPWNVTSQCFKSFLSTHSVNQPGTWADGVLFPTLFRRAGYKVVFATNQFYHSAAQGIIDFNGSFFLNDVRMDSLCFDFRNRFRCHPEGQFTSLLRGYTPGERNLYLLHLYGQHMEYAQRYPKDWKLFSAADIKRPDLSERERAIVADYDNATRYNDEVVARIMAHFRREDALVIYFSDHGEEVYDGDIGIYGRNHMPVPTAQVLRGEYEIPFMMWGSPRFRKRHPEVWARIKAARHRPFSHDDLPHLLMGLAGIATPLYAPQRDLLSPHFRPQRRLVKNDVDYDRVMQRAASPAVGTRQR